ncbi:MAG: prephenate dehydrogenase [Clostridiales bacterium]|nr:prephenate dehydrogenase [Clostridiales bacterium]
MNFARDEGILDEVSDDAEHVLAQGDIVFICLYPKETIAFIREHYRAFKDGAIITDCAGLKMEMTAFFNKMVKNDKNLEFIGGHPMAGSEKKGYENAGSSLLKGAPFILTPHEGNTEEAVETLTSLLMAMQFGEVTQMTAQVHDELVAYTSHLPHIIANALLVRKPSTVTKSLEGGSFRDVTRVGKMNTLLWQELIMSNQENVLKYLDDFNGQINAVKEAIQSHNTESLVALFEGH